MKRKILQERTAQQLPMATIMMLIAVAVGLLVLAIILTIGPVIGYNVENAVTIPGPTTGSGTLTLTGNVSCGELINVTNVAGKKVTFQINITGTGQSYCAAPLTTPFDVIEVKQNWNTSTIAANNITTAMNANASVSGTMTATNPSAGVVTLTYDVRGLEANSVATVETLANGAWGAATLTGGADGSSWNADRNTAILNGTEVWAQDTPLLGSAAIVVIASIIISVLLGAFLLRRR